MKTLGGQSGDKTALGSDGRQSWYLLMITVVAIQLVKVRGTL